MTAGEHQGAFHSPGSRRPPRKSAPSPHPAPARRLGRLSSPSRSSTPHANNNDDNGAFLKRGHRTLPGAQGELGLLSPPGSLSPACEEHEGERPARRGPRASGTGAALPKRLSRDARGGDDVRARSHARTRTHAHARTRTRMRAHARLPQPAARPAAAAPGGPRRSPALRIQVVAHAGEGGRRLRAVVVYVLLDGPLLFAADSHGRYLHTCCRRNSVGWGKKNV